MVDHLLDRGYRVRVIDNLCGGRLANLAHHQRNPDLAFEEADIRKLEQDDASFRGATCACTSPALAILCLRSSGRRILDTNVQGTVRVLECARHAAVRKLVYAASSSCYGLAATPTREDHPLSPQYPYALSKYQGEQAALHWQRVYRLPVNSMRIFNAYGTRDARRALMARYSACFSSRSCWKALHGCRRRHSEARLPLCQRRGFGLPLGGRDR